MPIRAVPEVAIVLPQTSQWGRDLLWGIIDYTRQMGPWQFFVTSLSAGEVTALPRHWRGAGVIGRLAKNNEHLVRHVRCPVVNVASNTTPSVSVEQARVATNYTRAAELAAEHLLNCGLWHFGLVLARPREGALDAFAARIERSGAQVEQFALLTQDVQSYHAANTASVQRRLGRWLKQLPKPVGIFAANDVIGRLVLQACAHMELAVPNDVAVVGHDNDLLLCEMAYPPLSSVSLATRRQGYEAAVVLDRLMHGESAPDPIEIDPIQVVVRQSSDIVSVEDTEVADAVRFIRQHAAGRAITVDDVLAAVPAPRRSLERRFRQLLGRSPAAEIRRVRFDHARHLLATTGLALDQVAASAGFSDQAHMCRVFQQVLGKTPRQFRQGLSVGSSLTTPTRRR